LSTDREYRCFSSGLVILFSDLDDNMPLLRSRRWLVTSTAVNSRGNPREKLGLATVPTTIRVMRPPPYRDRGCLWLLLSRRGSNFERMGPGGPSTEVYRDAHDPCHVAAAVSRCLIGSDGHGTVRQRIWRPIQQMFQADTIVTDLFCFDC
jgi:hypothetical protein